ncbi:MAG: hypothetical protein ACLQDV_15940 [Candidatus Binataceae bacterium]
MTGALGREHPDVLPVFERRQHQREQSNTYPHEGELPRPDQSSVRTNLASLWHRDKSRKSDFGPMELSQRLNASPKLFRATTLSRTIQRQRKTLAGHRDDA